MDAGRRRSIGPGGGPRRHHPYSTAQLGLRGEGGSATIERTRRFTLAWKSPKPDELEVTVPLKDAAPGPVNIAVYQFGLAKPDRVKMEAYAAAASLDGLTLNSGDKTALLKGTRLDEVAKAQVDGITFTPSTLNRVENLDQLQMNAAGSTASLEAGKHMWRGGVEGRPHAESAGHRRSAAAAGDADEQRRSEGRCRAVAGARWAAPDDLPVEGRLVFFLKSDVPAEFPRDEKVEVAAADSSFHTMLALSDGSLMLEDAHTAVANLEPLARFGSSAFGPVRVRAISADGAAGDWVPLGTLVRIPGFKELRCPRSAAKPCLLSGTDLFLAASFSATPSFDNPVRRAAAVHRNAAGCSPPGERRSLSEIARRSGHGADAYAAGKADRASCSLGWQSVDAGSRRRPSYPAVTPEAPAQTPSQIPPPAQN